jgi:hypothetical protein
MRGAATPLPHPSWCEGFIKHTDDFNFTFSQAKTNVIVGRVVILIFDFLALFLDLGYMRNCYRRNVVRI